MSVFSGKCDLYDGLIMIGEMTNESDFSKLKIRKYTENSYLNEQTFQFENLEDINVTCIKDLVPYYPFIESISCYNDGFRNIILSSRNFVDIEEESHLLYRIKNIKRYLLKCKRNNINPTYEDFCKKFWYASDENLYKIYNRVSEHPYKKNKLEYIKDIHIDLYNHYRKLLFDEMINNGYTEEQSQKWIYEGIKTW